MTKRVYSRIEQDQIAAERGIKKPDAESVYNPIGTIMDFLFKHGGISDGDNRNLISNSK